MGVYEDIVRHNASYAADFKLGNLQTPPARKLAILTCMDSRMDLEPLLNLNVGDAHMIRNAGGLATEDAMRSLILSSQLLGTRTIVVIQHTECGLTMFTDEEIRQRLKKETGQDADSLEFHAFQELDRSVIEQMERIRANQFLPRDVQVFGFVYDVRTGRLREIAQAPQKVSASSLR